MHEIDIFDLHAGKLAWYQETGADYDLKVATRLNMAAVETLLARTKHLPIAKILLPVGNDFFHIDNPRNTTFNETAQDVDTRWQKSFLKMKQAMVVIIERCMEVADVHVLMVPGNHDRTRTFYLGDTLESHFRHCPQVLVDNSPPLRKYVPWGVNLLGFSHGDEEKHASLPMLMAQEVPDLWAASKYREWHLGHLHQTRQQVMNRTKTDDGVVMRIIPSLSAPDAWHAMKGFKSPRAAESYVHDPVQGLHSSYIFNYFGTAENT
jgi:hypothetical protein